VRRLTIALAVAGLCLALAGEVIAGNGGIAPPDSATASGSAINDLYWIVIGITVAVFLLVEGALVWFLFRFRRRPGTVESVEGPQIHGNTRLEIIWTAIPFLILVAILVVTIVKVPAVQANPEAGEDPFVVGVTGHQFYWEYRYPNGVVTVDTLTLPVDRPVRLELTGADVIHSWWVPELTGKRDSIPGRATVLDFTIRQPGIYQGQCAELCGVEHAIMTTAVDAVPGAEFDSWLASEGAAQGNGTSDLGKHTWEGVCAKCHGLDGNGGYGPAIAGNSTLSDRAGLARLLADGQDNPGLSGYMPAVSQGWPEKQLDALSAYLTEAGLAPAPAEQAQEGGE
jgi:cytochrome c oxidase subunit II